MSINLSIDTPQENEHISDKELLVQGWVYPEETPISRIEIFLNQQYVAQADYPVARPDVAQALQRPDLVNVGYSSVISLYDLESGSYQLQVIAKDQLGNEEIITRNITIEVKYIDTSLDYPPENLITNEAEIALSGWAYSNKATIQSVALFLNDEFWGNLKHSQPRPDVAEFLKLSDTDEVGFSGLVPLDPGQHQLKILIMDTAGHQETILQTIHIEQHPIEIEFVQPQAQIVIYEPEIPLQAVITSNQSEIQSIAVFVNDEFVGNLPYQQRDGHIEVNQRIEFDNISSGEHILQFLVIDKMGNQKQISRAFELKEAPIKLSLDVPQDGDQIETFEMFIQGWAYSNIAEIKRVEAFLNGERIGDLKYHLPRPDVTDLVGQADIIDVGFAKHIPILNLPSGTYELEVMVTDSQGNKATLKREIIIDVLLPIQGSLDSIEDGILRGWASQEDETVSLDFYLDGEYQGSTTANLFRSDLMEDDTKKDEHIETDEDDDDESEDDKPVAKTKHIDEGKYGFEFKFIDVNPAQRRSLLDIRKWNSNISLPNFPMKVRSRKLINPYVYPSPVEKSITLHLKSHHQLSPSYLSLSFGGHALDYENIEIIRVEKEAQYYCLKLHIPYLLQDGQERKLQLTHISSGEVLYSQYHQFRAKPFGSIDSMNDSYLLSGWAVGPHTGSGQVNIDIFINEQLYATIPANLPRYDVYDAGFGSGGNAFIFQFSRSLFQKAWIYDVRLFISGTDYELEFPLELRDESEDILDYWSLLPSLSSRSWHYEDFQRQIAVIIPIYNALEDAKLCIESILEHTQGDVQLILINDKSTDNDIVPLLEQYQEIPHITVVQNERNLGFTTTVNRGIELAGDRDVILLNSDTVVGPRWIQNLIIAAYQESTIGTVTAVSDNAGVFSIPKANQRNQTPIHLNREQTSRFFAQFALRTYPTVHTGNGYCMYIKQELIQDIGVLDADAFPIGYGEENDFSMRAFRKGWKHVIDDATYIFHRESASFQETKPELLESGLSILNERYPEYQSLVWMYFFNSPDINTMRFWAEYLYRAENQRLTFIRPRMLFVISTDGGGTPLANQDLMYSLSNDYDPYMLRCDNKLIYLYRYDALTDTNQLVFEHALEKPIDAAYHTSEEYEQIAASILIGLGIELVHINHIAWHSLNLPKIAKALSIPVVFMFHDYYTIDPSVKLLNIDKTYSKTDFLNPSGEINLELWQAHEIPAPSPIWLQFWRERMQAMLQSCDAFVTPSNVARDILGQAYPFLQQENFVVIPHGKHLPQIMPPAKRIQIGEVLRILILGNIDYAKGMELLQAIKTYDEDSLIEFHFLGTFSKSAQLPGIYHGKYTQENFMEKIQEIAPHIAGIFSIWPETFSYTLTESLASGLPVIVTPFGAQAERITEHGGGWVLPSLDPQDIYHKLLDIADNPTEFSQKQEQVARWQQVIGQCGTIENMATYYRDFYHQLLHQSRSFPQKLPTSVRVGVIHTPREQSSYLQANWETQLAPWFRHPGIQPEINWQPMTLKQFMAGHEYYDLDVVVVYHQDVPKRYISRFNQVCESQQIKIVYVLPYQTINYSTSQQDIIAQYPLIEVAQKVLVSDSQLISENSPIRTKATYIPTVIEADMWLATKRDVAVIPNNDDNHPQKRLKTLVYEINPENIALLQELERELYQKRIMLDISLLFINHDESYEHLPYPILYPDQEMNHWEQAQWLRRHIQAHDIALFGLSEPENEASEIYMTYVCQATHIPIVWYTSNTGNVFVEDVVTGLALNTELSNWAEKLASQLNNQALLTTIISNAYQNILEDHILQQHTGTFKSLLTR